MTRASEYTIDDIKNVCKEKGLRHVSGVHVNGASEHHVVCLLCGLADQKASKSLVSKTKGRCRYLPCARKGILTRQYVDRIARENGCDLVPEPSLIVAELLSRTDIVEFSKPRGGGEGCETMSECWQTLVARKADGRPFFVPEHERIRLRPKLEMSEAESICHSQGMLLLSENIVSRNIPLEMKCSLCRLSQRHSISNLESPGFLGCVCKRAKKRFFQLIKVVEAKGFDVVEPEQAKRTFMSLGHDVPDKWDYRTRQYRPVLRCNSCGATGLFNTCGQIIHCHLVYCGNLQVCADAQRKRKKSDRFCFDKTDSAITLNIQLLSIEFASLKELREEEPYTYYRFNFGETKSTTQWRNKIFNGVEQLIPRWRGRKRKRPDMREIRRLVETGMRNGAVGGVGALRAKLPEGDHLRLADALFLARVDFEQIAQELKYKLKRFFDGMNLETVIEYLQVNGIRHAGSLRYLEPGLQQYLRRTQMLGDLYARLGWEPRVVYKEMTDLEIVETVRRKADEYQVIHARPCSFSAIEYEISSALSREIRTRGLQEVVADAMGWKQTFQWQSMSLEEIGQLIEKEGIFSLSDLHISMSGCYKELVRRDELDRVAKRLAWKVPFSISGKRCYSKTECVVLSFLDLNDITYSTSPRIEEFAGRKGGVLKADISLGNGRIVEIWATPVNSRPSGPYRDYPEARRYKEDNYTKVHIDWIGVEGIALYKSLPELGNRPGLEGFLSYLINAFKPHFVKLMVNDQIAKKIRQHLSLTYEDVDTVEDSSEGD